MKDKEGNGEKELLEEIFNNNEKSRASRAKSDGEIDSAAAILFSMGEQAKATVMAELLPSARGQNRDDFDDKKNEAEEGSKADGEKNNNNGDNDDGGGTGNDGNDNKWGGNGDAYDVGEVLDKDNHIAGESAEDLTSDQPLPSFSWQATT